MTKSATTTSPSSDEAITQWDGLVEATATRLVGTNRARRAAAEFDDLVQEGRIAVMDSLGRGVNPALVIENRMKDYITWLIRWRKGDHVPYETLLPLEGIASSVEE